MQLDRRLRLLDNETLIGTLLIPRDVPLGMILDLGMLGLYRVDGPIAVRVEMKQPKPLPMELSKVTIKGMEVWYDGKYVGPLNALAMSFDASPSAPLNLLGKNDYEALRDNFRKSDVTVGEDSINVKRNSD